MSARARRRTVRRGDVCIREGHAFFRELVDARRLVISAAIEADITPAEIVREDEEDIGLSCECRMRNAD